MTAWTNEIGVVMNARELGVTEDMLEGIAEGTFILTGGYKILTKDDVMGIVKESMGILG